MKWQMRVGWVHSESNFRILNVAELYQGWHHKLSVWQLVLKGLWLTNKPINRSSGSCGRAAGAAHMDTSSDSVWPAATSRLAKTCVNQLKCLQGKEATSNGHPTSASEGRRQMQLQSTPLTCPCSPSLPTAGG